ncbi:MAG: GGDEF domain-containing protein, partial [Elainellaceae cyanobacterium]
DLSRPMALILVDIDKFKPFNDTYGHIAGDQCLQQIAQGLQDTVDPSQGFVARLGGEEFITVLPEMDLARAETMAQRMLQHIRQLQIPHINSGRQYVSVSLGVATMIPVPDSSAEDLLHQVDQLLYQAKKQGGDTYCLSEA